MSARLLNDYQVVIAAAPAEDHQSDYWHHPHFALLCNWFLVCGEDQAGYVCMYPVCTDGQEGGKSESLSSFGQLKSHYSMDEHLLILLLN